MVPVRNNLKYKITNGLKDDKIILFLGMYFISFDSARAVLKSDANGDLTSRFTLM